MCLTRVPGAQEGRRAGAPTSSKRKAAPSVRSSPALRHTVLRAATPGLRRTLTAGAFVAAATAPALADESMIVVTDIGAAPPSVTEIVVHDLGPVPVPSTAACLESPDTTATTPPPEFTAPSTTDRWLVEPGDNLWAIAETVIAERSATPNRVSVADYWSALLTANADRLVDPDLIMLGPRFYDLYS